MHDLLMLLENVCMHGLCPIVVILLNLGLQ